MTQGRHTPTHELKKRTRKKSTTDLPKQAKNRPSNAITPDETQTPGTLILECLSVPVRANRAGRRVPATARLRSERSSLMSRIVSALHIAVLV